MTRICLDSISVWQGRRILAHCRQRPPAESGARLEQTPGLLALRSTICHRSRLDEEHALAAWRPALLTSPRTSIPIHNLKVPAPLWYVSYCISARAFSNSSFPHKPPWTLQENNTPSKVLPNCLFWSIWLSLNSKACKSGSYDHHSPLCAQCQCVGFRIES